MKIEYIKIDRRHLAIASSASEELQAQGVNNTQECGRRRKLKSDEESEKLGGGARQTVQTLGFPFLDLRHRRHLSCSKPTIMADRRRINGPPGGTRPAVFASLLESGTGATDRARRQRQPTELRKICKNRYN